MKAKMSGMPAMKGMKKMSPFGETKAMGAMKTSKPFGKGGVVNADLKTMGRNKAKAKNQK